MRPAHGCGVRSWRIEFVDARRVGGDHRQLESDPLRLLVGQQALALAAVQAQARLQRGDAVIVAGDVIDTELAPVGARGIARELDGRRRIGHQPHLPCRAFAAIDQHGQGVAALDRGVDLVTARPDGGEGRILAADAQHSLAALRDVVDEAGHLAARRHAQHALGVLGVEIDRRLARIGRRRDPQLDDQRRRRRESRRESRGHAIAAPAASGDQGDDQAEQRHQAQRARIAARHVGARRGIAQRGQALSLAAAMGVPHRLGEGIALANRDRVLDRLDRPVRHAAVDLQAALGGGPIGPAEAAEGEPGEPDQRGGAAGQQRCVGPGLQAAEDVEMRRRQEQRDKAQRGDQAGPQGLPRQCGAGDGDAAVEAGWSDRRLRENGH